MSKRSKIEWTDRLGARDGRTVRRDMGDRKGADPSEWPEDLRVQEFPEVADV